MRFADFLHPRFKEEVLDRLPSPVAALEASGDILWVNPAWDAFADANGCVRAGGRWGSYFAGITTELRSYYQEAFRQALATGNVFEQEYECSSPGILRRFHLRAMPFEGRVLLAEHVPVLEVARDETASPASEEFHSPTGTIAQCSNCRRTYHPPSGAFQWVPAWVQRPHPRTSHVICPPCARYYYHRPPSPSRNGT